MRVVVPTTDLRPETEAALDVSGWSWESVDVSSSDEAYYQLLAELWAAGETFAIVEHDIVVGPETLNQLADCYSDWCVAPYPYFVGLYPGLGCMKFGDTLLRRWPQALQEVGEMADGTHPRRHWCRLDAWLCDRFLQSHNENRCVHEQVGHVRNTAAIGPAHGCVNVNLWMEASKCS